MINIAFDVDDVMGDFRTPVLEIIKSRGYEYSDQTKYNISTTPQITDEELSEIFYSVDPYSIEISKGAQELCTRLYLKSGDPIGFVTSKETRCATKAHEFIKRFCKVPYTLSFSSNHYPKLIFLKQVNYFVEDRRKIAMHLAENGKTVIVPKKPWNKIREDFEHIDSIVYVDGITEILKNINLFMK